MPRLYLSGGTSTLVASGDFSGGTSSGKWGFSGVPVVQRTVVGRSSGERFVTEA